MILCVMDAWTVKCIKLMMNGEVVDHKVADDTNLFCTELAMKNISKDKKNR